MKKTLSICLGIFFALALTFVFIPTTLKTPVSAATSGYYTYTVSNGKAIITDVNTSISGDVTIPSKLGGYPVTSIGEEAFFGCSSLTSVTIPSSVTAISYDTFKNCTSLKEIYFTKNVTKIGTNAFYGCTALAEIWYAGTEADRGNITRDSGNDVLLSATWHFVDNACDTTCNICGANRTVPGHKYDSTCDTTCNECGATREGLAPHTYGNVCNFCGAMKYTPGDLDGIPGVSMDDAICLLFIINFYEIYPVNQPLDFDGNGKVDTDDAIYLLFHVNFPDSYPLH